MQHIFTRCVKIVESGSASAGLPCLWFLVVIKCRFTRQLVVSGAFESSLGSRRMQGLQWAKKSALQFSSGLEILAPGESATTHQSATRSPKEVNNIKLRAMFPSRFLGQSVEAHLHGFRSWQFDECGFLPRW